MLNPGRNCEVDSQCYTGLCDEAVFYPLLSGWGGINLALFPNGSSYYLFSDNHQHNWLAPAQAAHQLRSFCN